MPRTLCAPILALVLICAALPASAREVDVAAQAARFKEMQIRFMMRGAQRRADRHAAAERARRMAEVARQAGLAAVGLGRRPAPVGEPPDPPAPLPLGTAVSSGAAAIATNVLVNNRATDTANCGVPCSGQCEVSIAASGSNLVAAWNDGEGFVTGLSTQGFAYSTNNGMTWVDGGIPPTTNVGTWTSDPVVAVNEKTGAFYFAALCEPTFSTNGIGVVKGTFSGGVLTWGTPRLVISGNNNTVLYDKQWLAADSLTGNLYLIYTRFTVSGGTITTNRIDFQSTPLDNTFPWNAPGRVSDVGDDGLVQGARVAVGPAGEVWATWNTIGLAFPYADFMRVRRSTTQGSTWGAQVTGVSEFTNFGGGAPGFNRGIGFAFPGLAVDRSTGPRRGRVYLAWNESVNFFDDPIGTGSTVAESEPNDLPGSADPFTLGQVLTGTITANDFDYWSFNGVQGQTIICELDATTAPSLDASFRLFCTDQNTRLAFSQTGSGGTGLIVFTLPATGTYYLRVAPFSGTGSYTISTGLNGAITERGRDHRDIFTCYSDNGTFWSAPVRVNNDAARYDNWLPEIAVGTNGNVYTLWYDWRDAPASTCGGTSMTYLARSTDGAATWPDGSPVSSVSTAWTNTTSNIAPNQGDYTALYANGNAVYACWSDGRLGDPDVFMAAVDLAFTPVQVSLASTYAEPGLARVTWYAADAIGLAATVYRRTEAEEWRAVGQISPDGSGQMVFEDRTVAPGSRYHYRLGIREQGQEVFVGEVAVDVPAAPAAGLAIQEVRPNPADREVWVSFTLAGNGTATLELIDIAGRRVREREVSGIGRQMLDLAAGARLQPGVYLVRLTQAGRSVTSRVSVVR